MQGTLQPMEGVMAMGPVTAMPPGSHTVRKKNHLPLLMVFAEGHRTPPFTPESGLDLVTCMALSPFLPSRGSLRLLQGELLSTH